MTKETIQISISITIDNKKELDYIAEKQEISRNRVINQAIIHYIDAYNHKQNIAEYLAQREHEKSNEHDKSNPAIP